MEILLNGAILLSKTEGEDSHTTLQKTVYLTSFQNEKIKKLLTQKRYLSLSEVVRTAVNDFIYNFEKDGLI